MYIKKINIKNFRLLENVELSLENRTTVFVGRNNSGKTSLTELFRRLLNDKKPSFNLEDFSLSSLDKFWCAYKNFQKNEDENKTREILPFIEVLLLVNYEANNSSYGPLSEFIIDLNPDCNETLIKVRYELAKGKLQQLFEDIEVGEESTPEVQKTKFFKFLKSRISEHYGASIYAEDLNDSNNQKELSLLNLHALLQSGFISAQRGLDDAVGKDGSEQQKNNVIWSTLEQLFTTISNSENQHDKAILEDLESVIQSLKDDIDKGINEHLSNLLPTFFMFGYPGLSDPNLSTETTLDIGRLLKNHTKVHYEGINGINLPESYNGLGTRNLIYILLQLFNFYKDFTAKISIPGMNLIFIEEPEVHLHPQLQQVFIDKLSNISESFANTFPDRPDWPVQFVVTTHSSHIANKAQFEAIRYFLTKPKNGSENIRYTVIKDLKEGLSDTPKPDKEFLHKYMVLTGCDLLFADKVVLIEGATERIMFPEIIKKVDAAAKENFPKLSSQYVSIMEVGGAHAHKFLNLMNFLDLSTLIITDIDSVGSDSKACEVSAGVCTSNSCIKSWFRNDFSPVQLIKKSDDEKTKGRVRLCYQIPEQDSDDCGRSFEDAFILANYSNFGLTKVNATEAYNRAKNIKKTNFAIRYGIDQPDWHVPLYIKQGLCWLAASDINPPPQKQNDVERVEV
ncbi:MAG: ATP-dependent endonuclease [Rhodobacteraceae bacterium]|nr:ATP-dependent endonuclease [Paracoccaceae bacterium]